MLTFNILVIVSLAYVVFLFLVAFFADRVAERAGSNWLRSPLTYTLSLSVYCTAWTFYGAVGNAARSGLEYLTIYLGPTLVFLAFWVFLRRLVRIGRAERITSIADLISSRYGKSTGLAVLVTLLAVTGTTPYIALQLQSVTLSFAAFVPEGADTDLNSTAFFVAAGLALFTILFGTRNLDANERHHGVVTAIAVEAVVKLIALLAVGVFVVWGVSGGLGDTLRMVEASPVADWQPEPSRWVGMTFLSAAAIVCLPRMFQVMVVENSDERHLHTAAWAFPFYLMLMSLFVLPIAVVGLAVMPEGANPDLFVLTVPLALDRDGLAMLAFLGGFSSATSMVIVAAIALSTMVSNHIVLPLWLSLQGPRATVSGDVRDVMILSRRISIAAVLLLGYAYFRVTGGTAALSSIGLVAFAGVAQIVPALLGALYWRGATRKGALAGLIAGFSIWGYTLFAPAIGMVPASILEHGLFGIASLRPQALFGLDGLDPLVHSIFWSIALNGAAFIGVSLLTFPSPIERLQAAAYVNVFQRSGSGTSYTSGTAETEDLLVMAQRLLGSGEAQALFQQAAAAQGKSGHLPDPSPEFVSLLERELAGSVGAATAQAMIRQIDGGASVSVEDLLAVADETAQMLEYSNQLEAKSKELEQTASQLRDANEKLTALSVQKDAFLSQVSHELRTPMTSIRSFSEFLMMGDMPAADRSRYSRIIHDESIRLTRLLDDLLDLSVLESGQVVLNKQTAQLSEVIEQAVNSANAAGLVIKRDKNAEQVSLATDADRLSQVFINLITNAGKYCDAENPVLTIQVTAPEDDIAGTVVVDFIDNGSGIPAEQQALIFEKFSRLTDNKAAGSAGLGLAISREVMSRLGGTLSLLPQEGGTAFRVKLPRGHVDKPAKTAA